MASRRARSTSTPSVRDTDRETGTRHAVDAAKIMKGRRSQYLGHVRRVGPAHRGIHTKNKSNFFGRQREGDGPSRRLAFARRVDQQFIGRGFNNFLGGRRSSTRRGGPERLLVDGATLNKFFVALLQGLVTL